MMYLHFCTACNQIFILCGHQQECIKCGERLIELKLPYHAYVNLPIEQRDSLLITLNEPKSLARHKQGYRFSKQTKRYKQWNEKSKTR